MPLEAASRVFDLPVGLDAARRRAIAGRTLGRPSLYYLRASIPGEGTQIAGAYLAIAFTCLTLGSDYLCR